MTKTARQTAIVRRKRAIVRRWVVTELKARLNPQGLSISKARIQRALALLGAKYGYRNIKLRDVKREMDVYAETLIANRPRKRRIARFKPLHTKW